MKFKVLMCAIFVMAVVAIVVSSKVDVKCELKPGGLKSNIKYGIVMYENNPMN